MTPELSACIDQALRYLSLREHNRAELKTKLLQKKHSPQIIEQTLNVLEEEGSLSEERYVRAFVRSSNKRHPEGKSVMLARLMSKGTDRQTAKTVLDEIYIDIYVRELVENAKLALEKKHPEEDSQTIRQRLLKAGFSPSDLRLTDMLTDGLADI